MRETSLIIWNCWGLPRLRSLRPAENCSHKGSSMGKLMGLETLLKSQQAWVGGCWWRTPNDKPTGIVRVEEVFFQLLRVQKYYEMDSIWEFGWLLTTISNDGAWFRLTDRSGLDNVFLAFKWFATAWSVIVSWNGFSLSRQNATCPVF